MLVLSRHRDESITIGEMLITVVDIRGDKVRVMISAPSDIPVHRQEVYEAIRRENRKNHLPDPTPLAFPTSWKMPKDPSGLVLSRKRDESIVINSHIIVVVVDIRGDKVRFGIEAPQDVPVHRREVYDAIRRSNESQTQSPPSQPT